MTVLQVENLGKTFQMHHLGQSLHAFDSINFTLAKSEFLLLRGPNGVGKSTQADLMENYLASKGLKVVRTLEPGGTELGQEIRHLLLHRKGEVSARSEALLYAADRAHHVASKILPALEAGQVVITDRYLDSSVAYQGAGR